MKKINQILALIGSAMLFMLVACDQQGPAEEAGENIDEAAEQAGEAVDEAADEADDAVDDMSN